MRRVEFHNRERELKEIMDIPDAEPSLITFVYGPINSVKTALINHLIKQLPEDYVVFYINLRTKLLASYDDFIESLFEMELETEVTNRKKRETLKELISSVTKVAGIPINKYKFGICSEIENLFGRRIKGCSNWCSKRCGEEG